MLQSEGNRLTRVIVCTPRKEYFRVADLKAQNILEIADQDEARKQHGRLKSVMKKFGAEVIDIEELDGHPNSVFTRDVSLVTPGGYIKLMMGLEARRGEEEWMARILDSLGEPCAGEIESPGTVEGGDIILADNVAFVGHSERTNKEGIKQVSALLGGMEYEVRVVSMKGEYLHLGGAMSAIGPKRILCISGVFPDDFFKGFETVKVPPLGPSSANVVCLGEDEVIANSAENEKTIEILEKNGIRVHGLDLSEFRKGAGGPSCLILPLERK